MHVQIAARSQKQPCFLLITVMLNCCARLSVGKQYAANSIVKNPEVPVSN